MELVFRISLLGILFIHLCCQVSCNVLKPSKLSQQQGCNAHTSSTIATYFINTERDGSHCPSSALLFRVVGSTDDARTNTKLFLNVGFNKGFNFIEWMQAWSGNSKLTIIEWSKSMMRNCADKREICGMCRDCQEGKMNLDKDLAPVATLMHGVDINPGVAKLVRAIADDIKQIYQLKEFDLVVETMGLSNYSGTMYLGDCWAHWESCSLSLSKAKGNPIPINTMDNLALTGSK
jgi:hypothetical protein